MMPCKIKALVFVLFLIILKITENDADQETKRKCRRQLQKCSLKNECFSNLAESGFFLNEECADMASPRLKKSLYFDEKLFFSPHILIKSNFRKNWTYSVFLSDNYEGDNLELVTNCCKLRKGEPCNMPATHNKTRKFFVVFPYKKKKTPLYCYYRVSYVDAPIDVCEEGKPIIDKCIYFDNGDFKIKYKYTPLGGQASSRDTVAHDGCYFTLPSDMLSDDLDLRYDKHTVVKRLINVTFEGNQSEIAVGGYQKRYGCKHYHNVNSSNYGIILQEVFNPDMGDLVCVKVESFVAGYSFRPVLCQRVKTRASPLQVWQVAVPIAAFVGLILFISTVRVCRVFHETAIEKKSRPEFIDEGGSTTMTPDTPTQSEVFYEVHNYDESEDTAAPAVTVGLHEVMPSRSTESSTLDDKSGDISNDNDEHELLTERSARDDSIDQKDDSIPTSTDHVTSSGFHNPYDSKDPLLGEVSGDGCVVDGYMPKYFKDNIGLCSPSRTTYMSKYIKKNVRPRSPSSSGAFA